jgi:hypothetical protein
VIYCALRVGFLDDGDRLHGSTFHMYPCCRCISFYATRCAMLS